MAKVKSELPVDVEIYFLTQDIKKQILEHVFENEQYRTNNGAKLPRIPMEMKNNIKRYYKLVNKNDQVADTFDFYMDKYNNNFKLSLINTLRCENCEFEDLFFTFIKPIKRAKVANH